jgi:hypothetical protein
VAALLVTSLVPRAAAADRPVLAVGSAGTGIATWCLITGFFSVPAFGPAGADAGIDFQNTMMSPQNAIILLNRGDIALDNCVGLGTVAQAYKQGAENIEVVAVTSLVPTYVVIGAKGNKRLSDLKGKLLASNGMQTTATQALLDILARGANLQPQRDYTLVTSGNEDARLAGLASGRIEGISMPPPMSYQLGDEGYPILATEHQYVANYVQATLVTNRDWAAKNGPTLVAVLKRLIEQSRWLLDRRQKNDVLAKIAGNVLLGSKPMGPDMARRTYADMVAAPGGVADSGFASPQTFAETFNLFVERGLLDAGDVALLHRIVDFSYLNEARHELGLPPVPNP